LLSIIYTINLPVVRPRSCRVIYYFDTPALGRRHQSFGRVNCPRHVSDSTDDATRVGRWACKTWVVAVMDIQDHGIMGSWGLNMGADQGLLSTH